MSAPLPQCDRLFLTDSGLETDLIYNQGIELPYFAAFTLAGTPEGRTQTKAYCRRHLDVARAARRHGFHPRKFDLVSQRRSGRRAVASMTHPWLS